MVREPPNESLLPFIPADYANEIAYIISGWAQLEYDIDTLIWSLAGLEDQGDIGACLTAQFSTANTRLNALIALARVRRIPQIQLAKLNKFREKVGAIGERRNRVAHDPWLAAYETYREPGKSGLRTLDKMYRLQRTARSKLEHDFKPVSLDELRDLHADIRGITEDFFGLASEILQIFYTLP